MEELISKKDLYNEIAELESEALEYTSKLSQSDHIDEWRRMNSILLERTNFKFRVADAPVILEIPDSGIGDLSDGYHTFNQLYYQRMILFAALVKVYKDKAWKSHKHEDGELCFGGGWFVVGIDTPEGSYTYHYENKYWDMFDCVDLQRAKHWDGHTEEDAETRLMSLNPEPHWISVTERLPEEKYLDDGYVEPSQHVLIYMSYQTCKVSRYWGHRKSKGTSDYVIPDWMDLEEHDDGNVLAWMPLPEPFKGVTT